MPSEIGKGRREASEIEIDRREANDIGIGRREGERESGREMNCIGILVR